MGSQLFTPWSVEPIAFEPVARHLLIARSCGGAKPLTHDQDKRELKVGAEILLSPLKTHPQGQKPPTRPLLFRFLYLSLVLLEGISLTHGETERSKP